MELGMSYDRKKFIGPAPKKIQSLLYLILMVKFNDEIVG